MNGHVFQCYGEATKNNQFTQTMEELDNNYVGLHFKHHPSNIKKMMKLMQDTEIPEPTDNEDWASKTAVRIWDQEVIMYCKQVGTYKTNKCALYSVVWGQCSEAMHAKIKSEKLYDSQYGA